MRAQIGTGAGDMPRDGRNGFPGTAPWLTGEKPVGLSWGMARASAASERRADGLTVFDGRHDDGPVVRCGPAVVSGGLGGRRCAGTLALFSQWAGHAVHRLHGVEPAGFQEIRADALPGLARLVKEAAGQPGITTGNGEPNDARFHVLSAPGMTPGTWERSGAAVQLVVEACLAMPGTPRGSGLPERQ